jgi:hypothetical protein
MKNSRPDRMPAFGTAEKCLGYAPQAPGNSHCAPTVRFFFTKTIESRRPQSLQSTSITQVASPVEAGPVPTLGHGAILAIDRARSSSPCSRRMRGWHGSCFIPLERGEKIMDTILIVLVLLFLFGGGGYYWTRRRG